MSEHSAVNAVANFIIEQDLYDFNALSDTVQDKLILAFGFSFITKVNSRISMYR